MTLLVFLPLPVLALLCRGHTPSRLDTPNLPFWERRLPHRVPPRHLYALTTLSSDTVQVSDHTQREALLRTDEAKLLLGAEHLHRGTAAPAGLWLETACAWGRENRGLREKQDRVAARLMSVQAEDGFLGTRPVTARWTGQETRAQAACLRGLLAYYALTQRPAAIFAALSAADRMLAENPFDPCLALPLTRLYQATSDARYLGIARQLVSRGGDDGLGLCALYEATGRPEYLAQAQGVWAGNSTSRTPALTAELLLLTGRPQYTAALNLHTLNQPTHPGPELRRTAWARTPHGFALSTEKECVGDFSGMRLTQRNAPGSKARSITIAGAKATEFTLQVFLPQGPASYIWVDGIRLRTAEKPGGYAVISRRWRGGDVVTIKATVGTSPGNKCSPSPSERRA